MNESKAWYASWTMLFNLLIAPALVWLVENAASWELEPHWTALIIAAANVLLRLKTKSPIDVFSKSSLKVMVLVAVCSSGADAAPPSARINGPSGGIPGDSIALDASHSVGNVFRWDVTRRGFVAADTHYRVTPDGQRLEINSYPGVYDVTLTVANEEGIDLKRHTLVVWNVSPPAPWPPMPLPDPDGPSPVPPAPQPAPDPQPDPAPQPDPNPRPDPQPDPQPDPAPEPPQPPIPDLPDGQFGAARFVRDAVVAHVPASPQRSAEAAKLAAAWEGVAGAISAGSVRGLLSIRSALVSANQQAIGPEGVARWKAFGEVLGTKLGELYAAGAVATADDWATLLNEAAVGLRAAP